MKPVTGERAFPIDVNMADDGGFWNEGMTLRDYFAAKAMQEACRERLDSGMDPFHVASIDTVATNAYVMADAMLKARQE
jgi:hypothetical protein